MTVSNDSPEHDPERPLAPEDEDRNAGHHDHGGSADDEISSGQANPSAPAGALAVASPERSEGLSCEQTQKLIGAFLAGSLANRAAVAMRAHMGHCRNCLVLYRDAVQSAGSLSRNIRQVRERTPREKLRKKHRLMIAGLESARGAKRSSHIKLMLLPLALIFMFRCFDEMRGTKAQATWLAGIVEIGEEHLTAVQKEMELKRGDWVVTQEHGRGQIIIRSDQATISPDSQVLLEDARDRRLRLRRGELSIEGTWQVATTLGVILLEDGRAELGLRDNILRVTCLEGEVVASNYIGERRITAASPGLLLDRDGQGVLP